MPFVNEASSGYDLAVVGTGFASSFFLLRYLERAGPNARVIVLERGGRTEHATRIAEKQVTDEQESWSKPSGSDGEWADPRFKKSGLAAKEWMFTLGFGGSSNCWWGNTPRFLPADFETRTRFGVGTDWPIGYDDLVPYYDRVEQVMSIAGPPAPWPFPKSQAYPQPPHRMNGAERLLKAAYPRSFFSVPTARARVAIEGRGRCCANGVCHLCPADAKFTIQNGLMQVYQDPRVDVLLQAEVMSIDAAGRTARAVRYKHGGREKQVAAETFVLGANALFNPALLQRSGLDHPMLGKALHEQIGLVADVFLDGVDCFQGSTSVTGHSYMLYDDDARRREMAACLIETWNVGRLRTEVGRWQQVLPVRLVFEVVPEARNHVSPNPENPSRPVMHYAGHSDYTERAIARAAQDLARVMAPLPVESIEVRPEIEATEAHILGTTPMGDDPATSIVDRNGIHHQLRNLLVLGGSLFPASGPANPTLTISALSLRAADMLG